jgi:hypothetical protein
VDRLLQDKMSRRIAGEVGNREQTAKVVEVAVEVASHKNVSCPLKIDNAAAPAGRGAEGVHGELKGRQKAARVGH